MCSFILNCRPVYRSDGSCGTSRRPSFPRNTGLGGHIQQHQQPQQQQPQQQQLPVLFPKHFPNSSSGQMNLVPETSQVNPIYFSPRRSMPDIKPNPNILMSQMKRNSYQEESRFNVNWHHVKTAASGDLDSFTAQAYLSGYNHAYNSNSLIDTRRESNISTDSGYLMSLPESRRDSEVDTNPFGYKTYPDFRRDSEDFMASSQPSRVYYVTLFCPCLAPLCSRPPAPGPPKKTSKK
jgi:hypothetical protein